jgi:hypothetical protein
MFKKIIASLVLMFGLTFGVTQADQAPCKYVVVSSTSATQVCTGKCIFMGVTSTGVQTTAITVYDNTSQAGNLVAGGVIGTAGGALQGIPASGIQMTNGINVAIASSIVGTYTVLYYQ